MGLGIMHAMRMRHVVIFCLFGSTVFFSYFLIKGTMKKNIEYKIGFFVFSTTIVRKIFHSQKN
jgi:hypothetical protein